MTRHQRKIVTTNICPPIPSRQFDWQAHYDGEEEFGEYGYGATEQDAIADLTENYPREITNAYVEDDGQFGMGA